MANGKPIIFESIEILAAGGSAGTGNTYDLVSTDNITINNEPVTEAVEDSQDIISAFEQGFEVVLFDMDVLSDTNVQTDSTIVSEGKIIINGATGSVDVTIDNVRVTAHRPFQDLSRDHAMVQAGKVSTSGITVADA